MIKQQSISINKTNNNNKPRTSIDTKHIVINTQICLPFKIKNKINQDSSLLENLVQNQVLILYKYKKNIYIYFFFFYYYINVKKQNNCMK